MWPIEDIIADALILAMAGCVVALLLGVRRALRDRARGFRLAPLIVAIAVLGYVALDLLDPGPTENCIYAPRHPSDC